MNSGKKMAWLLCNIKSTRSRFIKVTRNGPAEHISELVGRIKKNPDDFLHVRSWYDCTSDGVILKEHRIPRKENELSIVEKPKKAKLDNMILLRVLNHSEKDFSFFINGTKYSSNGELPKTPIKSGAKVILTVE